MAVPLHSRRCLLESRLTTARWGLIALTLLLVLQIQPLIPWPMTMLLVAVLGIANAFVWWSLRSTPTVEALNQIASISTIVEWAAGFAIVSAAVVELEPLGFAALPILMLTTGARYAQRGVVFSTVASLSMAWAYVGTRFVDERKVNGPRTFDFLFLTIVIVVVGVALTALIAADQRWMESERRLHTHNDINLRRLQSGLSHREWAVLALLARDGFTYRDIAKELSISPQTVKSHVRHIGEKLGVTGRRVVIATARNRGLLPPRQDATDEIEHPT